jgi:hypothetical protein
MKVSLIFSGTMNISLNSKFFQGKYKISEKIQEFVQNFKPKNEQQKLIILLNDTIDSFSNKDKRDFFLHVLNITMNTNQQTVAQIKLFLGDVVDMVTIEHALPEKKRSILDSFTDFFKEKTVENFFSDALAGNKDALKDIAGKSSSLKDLSENKKHEIIKKLEAATLDMLTKAEEKMPQMHQELQDKYDELRDNAEAVFRQVSENLDHSSQTYRTAQKNYNKELEAIEENEQKEIADLRKSQNSQAYIILKHCRDILHALEPMLGDQYHHFMFTYDRTNNSALLNLLNFKDFDLSTITTEDELNAMIKEQIERLAENKKIDISVHRETKSNFPSLVRQELLEHHPDLAVPAKRTGRNLIIAQKQGKVGDQDNILVEHHKAIQSKPRWQQEQINSNLNRYLLEHKESAHNIYGKLHSEIAK